MNAGAGIFIFVIAALIVAVLAMVFHKEDV